MGAHVTHASSCMAFGQLPIELQARWVILESKLWTQLQFSSSQASAPFQELRQIQLRS